MLLQHDDIISFNTIWIYWFCLADSFDLRRNDGTGMRVHDLQGGVA